MLLKRNLNDVLSILTFCDVLIVKFDGEISIFISKVNFELIKIRGGGEIVQSAPCF